MDLLTPPDAGTIQPRAQRRAAGGEPAHWRPAGDDLRRRVRSVPAYVRSCARRRPGAVPPLHPRRSTSAMTTTTEEVNHVSHSGMHPGNTMVAADFLVALLLRERQTTKPICQRPVHRGTCGARLHRIAVNEREWGWADERGSTFGDRYPLEPYAELNRLSKIPARLGDYARLKAEVDLGGIFHQHNPGHTAGRLWEGTVPEHCDYPAYLSPSGWECRKCQIQL